MARPAFAAMYSPWPLGGRILTGVQPIKSFRFHDGEAWTVAHQDGVEQVNAKTILTDPSKAAVSETDAGNAALLFTNIEVAERYAGDCTPGYVAAGFVDAQGVLDFLEAQRSAGAALCFLIRHLPLQKQQQPPSKR